MANTPLAVLLGALALAGLSSAAGSCACGPYTYPDPSTSVPPTKYIRGHDIPGNDMDPCGSQGCSLPMSTTYLDCEAKCNATAGCIAYVFSVASCDTPAGSNVCWLKSSVGAPSLQPCRNYRVLVPLSKGPYCPLMTEWGTKVTLGTQPLPEYPRPQLVRGTASSWVNLNGLWEFQPGTATDAPPFGQRLNATILVPFPAESCLSGVWQNHPYLWYRKVFYTPFPTPGTHTILRFGAVDWQTTIWINGKPVGNHTGGYDGFEFDVTDYLIIDSDNELLVRVFDPSDFGAQVFGKQRVSAITDAGGDTYTPASGIWQTVWLENTPATYIQSVRIKGNLTVFTLSVQSNVANMPYTVTVSDNQRVVAQGNGLTGVSNVIVVIPQPHLWTPDDPFLYNITFVLGSGDTVYSYGGLRTFALGKDDKGVTRPMLNGQFIFLAGWLDQSYWPDGIYTAPSDEALAFDVKAVKTFGMNMIRLHQKVNSERWYWYTDSLGIIVFQDMVQHYGDPHGNPPSRDLFLTDFKAMMDGRYNHPSIVQWTAFNEGDMVGHFNATEVVEWAQAYDPSRLVDTDSGGPANDLHVGDVNDIHDYPDPQDPKPNDHQYAMIGEFGGIGAFIDGHEWWPKQCSTYLHVQTPEDEADTYIRMANTILSRKKDISASVYTQITDVERECDGFYNYDRTNKFTDDQVKAIAAANQALIHN